MKLDPNVVRLKALIAFQAKDYAKALEHLDFLVETTDHVWDHRWRGLTLLGLGKYAEAYGVFELLRSRCPVDPRIVPIMSLIKSSCPDANVRDSHAALELAHISCDSKHGSDWSNLSVLAAAYAEAADFEQATYHIEEVLRYAPSELAARFEKRRKQYRNHEPYRLPLNGFDGLVPAGQCERCGAIAFCSDGYPGTDRTMLCLECAKIEFASDRMSE